MKIAILGRGTVGGGVDNILKNIDDIEVSKVFVRPKRLNEDPRNTADINDIMNDPEIDGIVETLGGIDIPYEYITMAMKAHKFVVTANKAVVATHFRELHKLAKENGVAFAYEASVGGVLPILHTVKAMARFDEIDEVGGILNGTSNYILDSMTRNNLGFEEALHEAQVAGFAEADPSADIDGIDVKNKIMILGSLAFKANLEYDKIQVNGIRNITKDDIDYFTYKKKIVKLMAKAERHGNGYRAVVEPVILDNDSSFANIYLNNNAAYVVAKDSGHIQINGQGAGALPTGHAVVEDLVDIRDHRTIDFVEENKLKYVESEDMVKGYVRTIANLDKYQPTVANDQAYIVSVPLYIWAILKEEVMKQDAKAFFARFE